MRRYKDTDGIEPAGTMLVAESPYIAPRELMSRWRCSRSSVDRIASREQLKRLLLGTGRNGIVRYLRSEVEALERRKLA